MNNEQYINYNGSLYKKNAPLFDAQNRAFKYGDALFETIRIKNGIPCFIEDHFQRLKKGMTFMKMKSANMSFKELETQINDLIKKNKIEKGGRIRLSVFRNGNGLYMPENESKSYIIEASSIKDNNYSLNENGLAIDIYDELKTPISPLSQIKTTNKILNVLASIYKKEKKLDDCLILNQQGRIVETISSNIFLYKNNNLYTSSLDEGCIDGIMRKQILKIANKLNINVFQGMLTGSMLLQADELFLTNAIKGINWVVSYRQKRYYNKAAKEFVNELNQLI